MQTQINVVTASEDEDFVTLISMIRAIPEDFVVKSEAHGNLSLDGSLTGQKAIKAAFEGYTVLVPSYAKNGNLHHCLALNAEHAAFVGCHPSGINVRLMSRGPDAHKAIVEALKKLSPYVRQNKEPEGVWVEFAREQEGRVRKTPQFLRCPEWEKIKPNYTGTTRAELETLIALQTPWQDGSLMIWHGEPGTGKTYALRALMMAWRERFAFVIITDPEHFAGNPSYYFEVAGPSERAPLAFRGRRKIITTVDEDESESVAQEEKRVLFIMEDSADLILQESRGKHFDKVGKLLNMTDGLFGQGRQDMFLLTFNEQVDKIDPAFLRPGRCIAEINFDKFGSNEARGWLDDHGKKLAGDDAASPETLAELYAELRGKRKKGVGGRIGFRTT